MARPKKKITASQAAKILGCTTENIRQLAKDGIISTYVINNGTRENRYYLEAEILARKAVYKDYLLLAKDTEEKLENARRANEEATALEKEAIGLLKLDRQWSLRQARLSDMALSVLRAAGARLTKREHDILNDIITLKTVQSICNKYNLSRQRVSFIATKAIRHLLITVRELDEKEATMQENKSLRNENKELRESINYLKEHPVVITKEDVIALTEENYKIRELLHRDIRKKLLTRLADIGISVRAYNCLKAADIDTFADLVQYSRSELMRFRNFGRKSMQEIDQMVEHLGLSLGMDITKYGIIPNKKERW